MSYQHINSSSSDSDSDVEDRLPLPQQAVVPQPEAHERTAAQPQLRSPVELSRASSSILRPVARIGQMPLALIAQRHPTSEVSTPTVSTSALVTRDYSASVPGLSAVVASPPKPPRQQCNVLVIGGPQCGKSSFINAYRHSVLNHDRWPPAFVGRCGKYGTPEVMPYPSHPLQPRWTLIDTPGRLYTSLDDAEGDDYSLLSSLFAGIDLPIKLLGGGSLSIRQVSEMPEVPTNRVHQCIIVISARDLIEDKGQWQSFRSWSARYTPSVHALEVLEYCSKLSHHVRELQGEPPLVLVTHMDEFGGAGCTNSRSAVVSVLSECVPINAIYFAAFQPDLGCTARMRGNAAIVDAWTQNEMLRLHDAVTVSFASSMLRKIRRAQALSNT